MKIIFEKDMSPEVLRAWSIIIEIFAFVNSRIIGGYQLGECCNPGAWIATGDDPGDSSYDAETLFQNFSALTKFSEHADTYNHALVTAYVFKNTYDGYGYLVYFASGDTSRDDKVIDKLKNAASKIMLNSIGATIEEMRTAKKMKNNGPDESTQV